jgi:hypothetical protein
VSPWRTVYRSQPGGGGQGVRVGRTRVGVAVGYTVTTIVVGVGLVVTDGCLVNVGEAIGGTRVGVAGGWIAGALVGKGVGDGVSTVVGVGEGIAVNVGRDATGVGCDAMGVGGWTSPGRSPNANTRAAMTVTTTTQTAARLARTGRRRVSPVFWPLG